MKEVLEWLNLECMFFSFISIFAWLLKLGPVLKERKEEKNGEEKSCFKIFHLVYSIPILVVVPQLHERGARTHIFLSSIQYFCGGSPPYEL